MIERLAKQKKESTLRQRWKEINYYQLFAIKCCRKDCFHESNKSFLTDRIVYYRSLPRNKRAHALFSMNSSTGNFVFDGKEVCSTFLTKAFRFSPDLQSRIRNLPESVLSQYSDSIREACTSSMSWNGSIQDNSGNIQYGTNIDLIGTPLQRDVIINFLDRIVEDVAEMMPDSNEVHLPLFRKEDVYSLLLRDFSTLYPSQQPPSLSYFYDVWQKIDSM